MTAQKRTRRLLILFTGLLPVLAACQGAGITTSQQDAPVAWSLPKPNEPVDLSGLTRLPTPDALRQRHTTSPPRSLCPVTGCGHCGAAKLPPATHRRGRASTASPGPLWKGRRERAAFGPGT